MFKKTYLLGGLIPILMAAACSKQPPLHHEPAMQEYYPLAAEAIVNRDFNRLREFTEHENSEVRSLVYRAMAKSEPEEIVSLVRELLAMEPDSIPQEMWYVLSFQQLDDVSMALINRAFGEGRITSTGICELFYRQGSDSGLMWLLERPDLYLNDNRCALAMSTLLVRAGEDFENRENMIRIALTEAEPDAALGLIYGFYRASSGGQIIDPAVTGELLDAWLASGVGTNPEIDKFMVRILGLPSLQAIIDHYETREVYAHIQLSVEMARVAGRNADEVSVRPLIHMLLKHPNAHVPVQLMETLRVSGSTGEDLLEWIEEEITKHSRNDEAFVESIRLLHHHSRPIQPYMEKLEFFVNRNPYLLDRALPLFNSAETEGDYKARLLSGLDRGGIGAMHSMRALHSFWMKNRRAYHDELFRDRISLELEQRNRSVISVMQPLLLDDELIPDSFAQQIERAFRSAMEHGVRDNASVLRQILEDRFPERLNQEDTVDPEPFRIPDWQRLTELGTRPHWILETEKGDIEVRMDPLSAPFTVSSIDSLTRAGHYDGVTFHRVVRNFVIQGGDYDRRDGFGGPDYRIPTEPSFNYFERGAAGIASSGTDTEGSQFFFMHERAPHLDGNYTRFGEVVRGMDVVDRIQIGDKIIRARISIR
jgi:cyclophilin family peptidyl-prolyl cis-trans isomerase